jgi:hypothetical protein
MKDDSEHAKKDSGGKEAKKKEGDDDQPANESSIQEMVVNGKEEKEENDSSKNGKERCQEGAGDDELKKQSNEARSRGAERREDERYEVSPEKKRFGNISTQRQKRPEAEDLNDSMAEHKRHAKGTFRVGPVDGNHVRFASAKHSKKEDLPFRQSHPSSSTTSSSEDGSGGGGSSPTTQFYSGVQPTVLTMDQAQLRLPGSYRYREGGFQRLPPSKARMGSNTDWHVAGVYEDDQEDDGLELSDLGVGNPPRDQVVTVTEGVLVPDVEVVVGKVDTSRRRKYIRLGVLLLVIVVVVTVSVAVGVTMSRPRPPDTSTPAPTSAPTFAPAPVTNGRVVQFLQDPRLSNSTVDAMSVNGTPQFKAFQWLNSTNHPAIPDDSNAVGRMVQQFALATLYFATGGWKNASGWLQDPNECDWFGCNCTQTENETWVLDRLELPGNGLEASALSIEVGLLDRLTTLNLAENSFLGSIPSELGRLTSLKALALNNANFTGGIPTQIYRLTDLTKLDLDTNKLTGTISSNVGKLSKLTELNIWTNEGLTGSLPTQLGLLTLLTQVYMLSSRFSGPRLSGSIPSELGKLSQLTNLVMSGYQFSGTIPTELSRLTLLDWLYLQRNELSGSIPSELGRLTKLGELDVSANTALTGTVPASLCNLIGSNNLVVKVSCDAVNCTATCGCTCV